MAAKTGVQSDYEIRIRGDQLRRVVQAWLESEYTHRAPTVLTTRLYRGEHGNPHGLIVTVKVRE